VNQLRERKKTGESKLYTLFTIGAWYPAEVAIEIIEWRTRDEHILQHNDLPVNAPLFAYKSENHTWIPLLKSDFLKFVNRVWMNAKLHHVYGHSFRIGGAVALLLAGVPPEVVAATGGWTSLSFLLYWRRLEEILPNSTSRAYNKSDVNFLSSTFEKFRTRCDIPRNFLDSDDINSL
jgi:hypothetical protein